MREATYTLAVIAIVGLFATVAVGIAIAFPEPSETLKVVDQAVSLTFAISAFASWILAVWVWSRVPRSGVLHSLSLPLLVVFGLFWAPWYSLFALRHVPSTTHRSRLVA